MACDELDLLVGQLFIFGFYGYEVSHELVEFYEQYPVGGIILFRRNLKSREQIRKLTIDLQELGSSVRPDQQLLISIDQEGGNLSPLRGFVTSLPGNMGLAATGNPSAAYFTGLTTGRDLSELGFNLDLAPVLDLASVQNPVIGTRAFSNDVETTVRFGTEFAKGIRDSGILFTAKHFPGHGCCSEDSHVKLPNYRGTLADLEKNDLVPFRAIVELEGSSVMMAHVKYEQLDPDYPASLSEPIHRFLRSNLNFDGVVLTDCLEMKAIQNLLRYPEDAVKAIEAGNDLVLISHTPEHQRASFNAVKAAVCSGRISVRRIEESVQRVQRWKRLLDRKSYGKKCNTEWSSGLLAENVITYIPKGLEWKFNREPLTLVTPEFQQVTLAEDFSELGILDSLFSNVGLIYKRINCSANPSDNEIAEITCQQEKYGNGKVVFVLSNPGNSPGQCKLIEKLTENNRVILVGTRNPLELESVKGDIPALLTYSTEAAVMDALAKVLSGSVKPGGVYHFKDWRKDKTWKTSC